MAGNPIKCPDCDGTGLASAPPPFPLCKRCDGRGVLTEQDLIREAHPRAHEAEWSHLARYVAKLLEGSGLQVEDTRIAGYRVVVRVPKGMLPAGVPEDWGTLATCAAAHTMRAPAGLFAGWARGEMWKAWSASTVEDAARKLAKSAIQSLNGNVQVAEAAASFFRDLAPRALAVVAMNVNEVPGGK